MKNKKRALSEQRKRERVEENKAEIKLLNERKTQETLKRATKYEE